jgi:hypothetical protein
VQISSPTISKKHLFKFPHRNERKEKMENHFPQKKVPQFAKNKKAKKRNHFLMKKLVLIFPHFYRNKHKNSSL